MTVSAAATLAYDAMAGLLARIGPGNSCGETCWKMRGWGNFAALASNSDGTHGMDPEIALAKHSPNWLVVLGLFRHAREADDGWLILCCCDSVDVE